MQLIGQVVHLAYQAEIENIVCHLDMYIRVQIVRDHSKRVKLIRGIPQGGVLSASLCRAIREVCNQYATSEEKTPKALSECF